MDTHVVGRPRAIMSPHHFWLLSGGLVVLVGIGMAATGMEVGVALACAGGALLVWRLAALDKDRTLARLEGQPLGEMAVPLPVLPGVSAHPHRDIACLPATVPAVVPLPGGGWGLVPYDTATAALRRPGFNGRWHTVAQPMHLYSPGTSASRIGHIPRDSAAVLVDCGGPTPWGVTGVLIRAWAEQRLLIGTGA